ncbi:C1 family peptidase [Bdellovibrio sp. HCB290]|uniref:C1 family peptidase n=1 Tax=Bdellovibrio sp. HCB290 TaxID=3394356 RepID=UPI0039B6DE55
MRILALTALFLIHFGSAQFAAAAGPPLCSTIFSGAPWGTLRPDFKHNTGYTKEIPQSTAIKNQCNLGTCHMHSWLASIEKSYAQRTGDVITLSNHYESAQQLLNRSLAQLKFKDLKVKIELGASPLISRDSILEYGVIPEGVWSPKTEFYKNPTAQKIQEYLENIVARSKWLAEKATTPAERIHHLETGAQQIKDLLNDVIGDLPTQFEYQGRSWTPQEFAKTYFSFFEGPQTMMLVQRIRNKPTSESIEGIDTKINTDIDTVETKTASLIDQGSMVYLSYEHHAEYVDKSSGIMSIRAFYTPSYAKPLNREARDAFKKNDGGHAVQIIGYERNPETGQIIKWKIKNSWGTGSGDEGYYHMYNDYFRAFTKGVTFTTENLRPIPLKMPVKSQ